ncbi:response regulator [Maridesulfovibrio sp. FT414]|uniref:response regulator n=1 Tax=Maridesulfovibrio sp. FT414 TaxID=2979469 RepID=UPI003D800E6C
MNSKGRVLIVDDEERFRNSLRLLLAKGGYDALGAADGMAAMHILEKDVVDVVILDSNLPNLKGEDISMIIREHGIAVEIIILTGVPVIENALLMMRNGVFDYLAKPVSIGRLMSVVERAVKNKRIRNWDTDAPDLISGYIG